MKQAGQPSKQRAANRRLSVNTDRKPFKFNKRLLREYNSDFSQDYIESPLGSLLAAIRRSLAEVVDAALQKGVEREGWLKHAGIRQVAGDGFKAELHYCDGQLEVRCRTVCIDPDEGVIDCVTRIGSESGRIVHEFPAAIGPDAWEQCVSAHGTAPGNGVMKELYLAVWLAPVIADVARQWGWSRVGVPTERGMFRAAVGENYVALHSYLNSSEMEPGAPWDRYLSLVAPLISACESRAAIVESLLSDERVKTDLLFLFDEHEPRGGELDAGFGAVSH